MLKYLDLLQKLLFDVIRLNWTVKVPQVFCFGEVFEGFLHDSLKTLDARTEICLKKEHQFHHIVKLTEFAEFLSDIGILR